MSSRICNSVSANVVGHFTYVDLELIPTVLLLLLLCCFVAERLVIRERSCYVTANSCD